MTLTIYLQRRKTERRRKIERKNNYTKSMILSTDIHISTHILCYNYIRISLRFLIIFITLSKHIYKFEYIQINWDQTHHHIAAATTNQLKKHKVPVKG